MSTASTIPPIGGTVTVGVPVEQAFRVFTDSFNTWWPAQYHIGQADMAEAMSGRNRVKADGGTNGASTAASATGDGC